MFSMTKRTIIVIEKLDKTSCPAKQPKSKDENRVTHECEGIHLRFYTFKADRYFTTVRQHVLLISIQVSLLTLDTS